MAGEGEVLHAGRSSCRVMIVCWLWWCLRFSHVPFLLTLDVSLAVLDAWSDCLDKVRAIDDLPT